jgi:hypothetical protein
MFGWRVNRRLARRQRARDKFAEDDPLRYLHVPLSERIGQRVDLMTTGSTEDASIDREWFRKNPGDLTEDG